MTGWVLFAVTAAAGGLGAGLRYIVDVAVMRGRQRRVPARHPDRERDRCAARSGSSRGSEARSAATLRRSSVSALLGGYTTFSTVSGETVLLGRRGRRDWAWANLLGTLVAAVRRRAAGSGWPASRR